MNPSPHTFPRERSRPPRRRRGVVVGAVVSALALLATPLVSQSASAATLDPGAGNTVRVQEGDPALVYDGPWRTMSGGDSAGGIRFLNRAGSVTLTFRGTGFTWISRTTSYAGIASVSLDGEDIASVDRYSPTAKYKVPVFSRSDLPDTLHTVTIAYTGTRAAASKDKNLVIDAFDIVRGDGSTTEPTPSDTPTPVDEPEIPTSDPSTPARPALTPSATAPLVAEETDPVLVWKGRWKNLKGGDSGGSMKYLTSAGSVSFDFIGTSFRWLSRTTSSSGIADVSIDGGPATAVDRYSPTAEYQVPVFEKNGLDQGRHTVTVSFTGKKNPKSSGKNLIVDAFVLSADGLAVGGVTLAPLVDGYAVAWNAPLSSGAESYDVFRSKADGSGERKLASVADPVRLFRDEDASADEDYRYWVEGVDGSGSRARLNESVATTDALRSQRAAVSAAFDCPTPTTTVSDSGELDSALRSAGSGDVIRLADGEYTGEFALRKTKDVWLCGSPAAVVTSGDVSSGTALMLNDVEDVHLTGFTVRDSFQGVQVLESEGVTIAGLTVTGIGYEAVHLRSQTTDSLITGTTIRRTGLVTAKFGEGVYIGTSDRNWCKYNDCDPDRSARISIIDNTISDTGAEPIEAKEGTLDGSILGNTVSAGSRLDSDVSSLVLVSGNEWRVSGNTATGDTEYGYQVITRADGSGNDNSIDGNLAVGSTSAPVYLHQPSKWTTEGNTLSCSNSGADPVGTQPCTP